MRTVGTDWPGPVQVVDIGSLAFVTLCRSTLVRTWEKSGFRHIVASSLQSFRKFRLFFAMCTRDYQVLLPQPRAGPGYVLYCLQEYGFGFPSLLYCDAYYVIVRQFRYFSNDGHHRLTSTHHSDWGPSFTCSRSGPFDTQRGSYQKKI